MTKEERAEKLRQSIADNIKLLEDVNKPGTLRERIKPETIEDEKVIKIEDFERSIYEFSQLADKQKKQSEAIDKEVLKQLTAEGETIYLSQDGERGTKQYFKGKGITILDDNNSIK